MDQKKMNFIKTQDKVTAQQLRENGFTELTRTSDSVFCFINDGKLMFDEKKKELVYTNVLCL